MTAGELPSAAGRPSSDPGERLPERRFRVRRTDLVRYAKASGDTNPIHHSDAAARGVGLPGVIAHGMLTMALAQRAVTDWVGDPGRVLECSARFTRPVVVPDDDVGAEVVVEGTVAEVRADGTARVDLTVTCQEEKVLGAPRTVVRLS